MEWLQSYWWLIVLAVLVFLIVMYRRGSFRMGARGLGFGLDIEGKAAEERQTAATPKNTPAGPTLTASGPGSVVVGRDANNATFNTDGRKR